MAEVILEQSERLDGVIMQTVRADDGTEFLREVRNASGANGMKSGDRVRYTITGRTGIADEFLSDGDTFVTWDDGTFGTVKWNHLVPEPK